MKRVRLLSGTDKVTPSELPSVAVAPRWGYLVKIGLQRLGRGSQSDHRTNTKHPRQASLALLSPSLTRLYDTCNTAGLPSKTTTTTIPPCSSSSAQMLRRCHATVCAGAAKTPKRPPDQPSVLYSTNPAPLNICPYSTNPVSPALYPYPAIPSLARSLPLFDRPSFARSLSLFNGPPPPP